MKTHTITFRKTIMSDLKTAKGDRMERLKIEAGEKIVGNVRCKVIQTSKMAVEVADVEFSGGMLSNVPCAYFQFVDSD